MPNTPQDFFTLGKRLYPEASNEFLNSIEPKSLIDFTPITALDESAVYNSNTLIEDPKPKKDPKPIEDDDWSMGDILKGVGVALSIFSGNPLQKELTKRVVNNVDDTINTVKAFPSVVADFGIKLGGYLYSSSADSNASIDPMYYGYNYEEPKDSETEWRNRKKKVLDAFEWENEASKDVNKTLGYEPKGTFGEDVVGGVASLFSFAALGMIHPSLALMGGAFTEAESFGNEIYTTNVQKGMSPDEAYDNAMIGKAIGFGVGLLEAAPVNNLIGRVSTPFKTGKAVAEIFKQTDDALFGKMKSLAGSAFKESVEAGKQKATNLIWQGFKEEGLQEFTQGLVEEIARPSLIKDHKFDMGSVLYQGFIGGLTGGLAGGVGAGIKSIGATDEVGAMLYKREMISNIDKQIASTDNKSKIQRLEAQRAEISNASFEETLGRYKYAKDFVVEKELVNNELSQIKKNGYTDSARSLQIKSAVETSDFFQDKVKEKQTINEKSELKKTDEEIKQEVHNELLSNLRGFDLTLSYNDQLALWKLESESTKKIKDIVEPAYDEQLRNAVKTESDFINDENEVIGKNVVLTLQDRETEELNNLNITLDTDGNVVTANFKGGDIKVPLGTKYDDFITSQTIKSIFDNNAPQVNIEQAKALQASTQEKVKEINDIKEKAYAGLSQLIINKTTPINANDRLFAARITFQQNPSPASYANFRKALIESNSEPDVYTEDGEITQEKIDKSLKTLEDRSFNDYKEVSPNWTPVGTNPSEIIRTAVLFQSISYESMNLPVDINSFFSKDEVMKSEGFEETVDKRKDLNVVIREFSKQYPAVYSTNDDASLKASEINNAFRDYYQKEIDLVKVVETEDGQYKVVYLFDTKSTQTKSVVDIFDGMKIRFQGVNTQFTFLEGLSYMKIWYYANNPLLAKNKEVQEIFKSVQNGTIKPNEAGRLLLNNKLLNLEAWNDISFSVIENYVSYWKNQISSNQLSNIELNNTTNNSDIGLALYFLLNPDYSVQNGNKKTLFYLNNIEMQDFNEIMPVKDANGQIVDARIKAKSLYHGLATYLSFYYPEIDRNSIQDMSFTEARSLVLSKNISIIPQSIAEKLYRVYQDLDWNYININNQTFGINTNYFKSLLNLIEEFKKLDTFNEEITHQGIVFYELSQKVEAVALKAKFPEVFNSKQVILKEGRQSQSLYDILLTKKAVTRKIIIGSQNEMTTETQFVLNDLSEVSELFNRFLEPNQDSTFEIDVQDDALTEEVDVILNVIKNQYPNMKIDYKSGQSKLQEIQDFILTGDQQKGLNRLNSFMRNDEDVITLRGAAGTGKTTLMKFFLRNNPDSKFLFVSPTHKALRIGRTVLSEYRKRLGFATLAQTLGVTGDTKDINITAETVNADVDFIGEGTDNKISEKATELFDAIIVDESSMVNDEQYEAFIRLYPNIKIIFIGDPNQLKGIKDDNNMLAFANHENIILNEITRQGTDSPIISLSQEVLKDQTNLNRSSVKSNTGSVTYLSREDFLSQAINDFENGKDAIVLTQTNKTANVFNERIRTKLFGDNLGMYVAGEKLISTNSMTGIRVNGSKDNIGTKYSIKNSTFMTVIDVTENVNQDFKIDLTGQRIDKDLKKVPFEFNLDVRIVRVETEDGVILDIPTAYNVADVNTEVERNYGWIANQQVKEAILYNVSEYIQFNPVKLSPKDQNRWLRGYAITMDKSQGSTFDNVYVYEEELDYYISDKDLSKDGNSRRELSEDQKKRYRYTAFTRARTNLNIYHRAGNTQETLNVTDDNSRFVYPDYELVSTEELFKSEGVTNDFEMDDIINAEMNKQYGEEYGYTPETEEFESTVTSFKSANEFDTVILIGDKVPSNVTATKVIKRSEYDYKLHPNTVVIYSGNLSNDEEYFINTTALTVIEGNRLESYVNENKEVLSKIKVKPSGFGYQSRTKENANNSNITVSFYNLAKTFGEVLTRRESKSTFNVNLNTLTSDEQIDEFADQLLWQLINDITLKKIKNQIVINIAGNGINNLFISQEKADQLVSRVMDRVVQGLYTDGKVNLPITIRSGMQTGIDEAGIKWALSRGVNIESYIPSNYITQTTNKDYFSFFDRFVSKPLNSPVEAQTPKEAIVTSPIRVEIQEVFSVANVRANKDKSFLFGDNLEGYGKKGQAIIRDEPNAYGIPTKKKPSMSEDAFFTDDEYDANVKAIDEAFDKIPKEGIIVLPSAGLGTGLAELNKRAPKTFEYLQNKLVTLYRYTPNSSQEGQGGTNEDEGIVSTTQETTSIPTQVNLTESLYNKWRENYNYWNLNSLLDYLGLYRLDIENFVADENLSFKEKLKNQALLSNVLDGAQKYNFPLEWWKGKLSDDKYALLLEAHKKSIRFEKVNMLISGAESITYENFNEFVQLIKELTEISQVIFSDVTKELNVSWTKLPFIQVDQKVVKEIEEYMSISSIQPLQSTNSEKTTKSTGETMLLPQRAFNEAEAISYFNEKDESISEFGDWVTSVAKGYNVQIVTKDFSVKGMKLGNDRAFYDSKTKTIYINQDVVKGKQAQYKEFIHELTHHYLIPMLDNNPEFYQAVLSLGTEAYKLAKNSKSYENNKYEFDKVFKHLLEGRNRVFVNEFVAHVMSNTSLLNQWMKETPFDEKNSIYAKGLKIFLTFFKRQFEKLGLKSSLYNQLENVLGYYAGYSKTKDIMDMKGLTSEPENNISLFLPLSSVLLPDAAFSPVSLVPIGRVLANTNNVTTIDYISYLQGLSKQELIDGINETPDLLSSFEALLIREELEIDIKDYIKLKVTALYNLLQNTREAKVYRLTHNVVDKEKGWKKALLPLYYTNLKKVKDSSYRESRRIDKAITKILKEFGLYGEFVYLDQIETVSVGNESVPREVIGYKKNEYYIKVVEDMNTPLLDNPEQSNNQPFHLYLGNFGALNTVGMVEIYFNKAKLNAMEKTLRQKYAKVSQGMSLSNLFRLAIEDERFNNLPSNPESRILNDKKLTATKVFKRHYDVSPELRAALTVEEKKDIYETLLNKTGIAFDGKDIIFNAFIFDSENSDMEMEIEVAGEKITFNMRDILLNAFGKETTDGGILYLNGGFNFVHEQAFGVEKDGVIKAWASNVEGMQPLFLKASYQKVPMSNDLISLWMKQNNISLLISSSAAKVNDYGSNDISLLVKGESQGKTVQLPLSMFNRQGEKETAYEDGIGISTGLVRNIYTQYNPAFKSNEFNELITTVLARTIKGFNRKISRVNGVNLIEHITNSLSEETFSNMELTVSKMILSVLQNKSITSDIDYEMMTAQEKTAQDIKKQELFEELGNIFHDPFFAQTIQDYIRKTVQDYIGFNLPSKYAVLRPDLGFLMNESLINEVWKNCKAKYETEEQARKEFWKIVDKKSGRLKDDWMYLSSTMAKQTTESLEERPTKITSEPVGQYVKMLQGTEQSVLLDRLLNEQAFGETEIAYEGYNKIVHGLSVQPSSMSLLEKKLNRSLSRVGYTITDGVKRLVALTDKNRPIDIHDKDLKEFLVDYFSYSLVKRTEEKREISQSSLNKKSFGKSYIITAVPTDSPHSQQPGRVAAVSNRIDASAVVLNSDHWQVKAGKDFDIDTALITYYTEVWGKEWDKILEDMTGIGKKHTSESIKAMSKILERKITEKDLYDTNLQIEFMQKLFGSVDNTKLNDYSQMNGLLDIFPKTVGTLIRNKAMYSAYSGLGVKANASYSWKDVPNEIRKVLKKIGITDISFDFTFDSSTEDVGVIATMYQRWLNDQVDKPSTENGLHYNVTPEGLKALQYNQQDSMAKIVKYKSMVQSAFNFKKISEKEYYKAKNFFDSIVNTSTVWNDFLFDCAFGARKKYHRYDSTKTKDFNDTMVEIQQQQMINKMLDEGNNEGLINFGMQYAQQAAMYKQGASYIPEILHQLLGSMSTNQKTNDLPFLSLFNKIDFNLIPQMKTGVWEYKNWIKNYKKKRLNNLLARVNFTKNNQTITGNQLVSLVNSKALTDTSVYDKDYGLDMRYFVATKFMDFIGLTESQIAEKLTSFDTYIPTQELHQSLVDILSWINLNSMSSSYNNYWKNFKDQYYRLSIAWARMKNPNHFSKYDPDKALDLSYLDEFDYAYIRKIPTLLEMVSSQDQLVMSSTDFRNNKNIGKELQSKLDENGHFKGFLFQSYKSLDGEKVVIAPMGNNLVIRVKPLEGEVITFPTIKSLFNARTDLSQHIINEIGRISSLAVENTNNRPAGYSENNVAYMEAFQIYSMVDWKSSIPLSSRINEAVELIQSIPYKTENDKLKLSYALVSLMSYPRGKSLAREFRLGTKNQLDYERSAFGEYPNNQVFWEIVSKANPELANKYMNTLSKEYPDGRFFEKVKLQQPYKDEMYYEEDAIWKSEGLPTEEDIKNLQQAIQDSDSFDINPKYSIWSSLRYLVWKHKETSVDSYDPDTVVETIPSFVTGGIKSVTAVETFNSVTKSGVTDRVPKMTRGMILFSSIEKWIEEMRFAQTQKENEMINEYNLIQKNFIKTLTFNKKSKTKQLNEEVYDNLLHRLNRIDVNVVDGDIVYGVKNQKFEVTDNVKDIRQAVELAFPKQSVEDKLKLVLALNIKTRLFGHDTKYIKSMISYLEQVLDTYKSGETYNLIMDHLLPKYQFMLKAKESGKVPIYMKTSELKAHLVRMWDNPADLKTKNKMKQLISYVDEYTAKNRIEFFPLHQFDVFKRIYEQALLNNIPFEKNVLPIMSLEQGHFFGAMHNDMTYLIYRKFVENETNNAELSDTELDTEYLGQVKAGIMMVSNHRLLNSKPIAKEQIKKDDEIVFLYTIEKEVTIKGKKEIFTLQKTVKGTVIKRENGRVWIRQPAKVFIGQRQIEGRKYFVPEGQEFTWEDVRSNQQEVYAKLAEGANYSITEGQYSFIVDLIEDDFVSEKNLEIIKNKGISNLSFQDANEIINQAYGDKLEWKGSAEGWLEKEFSMPESVDIEIDNERTEVIEKKTLSDRVLLINRPSRPIEVANNTATMLSVGMSMMFLGGVRPGFNNWYDGSTQLFNHLGLEQWLKAGLDYRYSGGKTAMKEARKGKGNIKKFQEIVNSEDNMMTATELELVEAYTYEFILKHNLVTQIDNMDIFKKSTSNVVETLGKTAQILLKPFTKAEAAVRIKAAFYFSYKAIVLNKITDKKQILSTIDSGVSFTQSLYEALYRRTIENKPFAKMLLTFGQYGFYQREQTMIEFDVAKLMGDKFELKRFIKGMYKGDKAINHNRINEFYRRLLQDYVWMATIGHLLPGLRHGGAVNKSIIFGLKALASLWISYLYDDDDKFDYTDFLFAFFAMFGGSGITLPFNMIKPFVLGQFSEAVEEGKENPKTPADKGGVYSGLSTPPAVKEMIAVNQLLGIDENEYREKQHAKYEDKGKKIPDIFRNNELVQESNYLLKTFTGTSVYKLDNKYLKPKLRGMANRDLDERVEWWLSNPLEYALSPILPEFIDPNFKDSVLVQKDTPKPTGGKSNPIPSGAPIKLGPSGSGVTPKGGGSVKPKSP